MLFWILSVFAFAPIPGFIIGLIVSLQNHDDLEDTGANLFLGTFAGFGVALLSFPVFVSWDAQASDISKIEANHHRITVYEERIESLEQRLSDFDYPSKPMVSVDADTPWASMVKSLNDAESELARAKDERAIAIRSISARMRGPMSGVVDFVGLPDGWDES